MYDTSTSITEFATAVEGKMADLAPSNATRVHALARRQTGAGGPFARGSSDLRANLRACFVDRAFVTLAAVACIVDAEIPFGLLVERCWDGDIDKLLEVGGFLARAEPNQLNTLIVSLGLIGLAEIGQPAERQAIRSTVLCRIATAADERLATDEEWLKSIFTDGMMAPVEAVEVVEVVEAVPPTLHTLPIEEAASKELDALTPVDSRGLVTTLAAALRRPLRPRRRVFGPMIELGSVSMLAAAPGIGKTTMGVAIACAVASGSTWAGFEVEHPGRVLYVNAEDSGEEVSRRFAAAQAGGLLAAGAEDRIHLVYRFGQRLMEKAGGTIDVTNFGRWLEDVVRDLRPSLILVDPLAMTHALDENNNAEMAALLGFFATLAAAGDAGVLIVHHTTKAQKDGAMAARGAGSILASVRNSWQLSEPEKGNPTTTPISLSCTKSNHYAIGPARLFIRREVTLANGDVVGLIAPAGGGSTGGGR